MTIRMGVIGAGAISDVHLEALAAYRSSNEGRRMTIGS